MTLLEEHHGVKLEEEVLDDDKVKIIILGEKEGVRSAENELTEVRTSILRSSYNFHWSRLIRSRISL